MNIDEESETRCQSTRSNSFRESFEATFYDQKPRKQSQDSWLQLKFLQSMHASLNFEGGSLSWRLFATCVLH